MTAAFSVMARIFKRLITMDFKIGQSKKDDLRALREADLHKRIVA